MRKQALMKSVLLLLPVLAVGLATTGNSVTVFDTQTGVTSYYSYFSLLPVETYQMLTPVAALLTLVTGILAVIYLISKKTGLLKVAGIVALVAACVAVLPVVRSGDVKVIPNVGLPLFMLLEYVFAFYVSKAEQQPRKEEKRLKNRRK